MSQASACYLMYAGPRIRSLKGRLQDEKESMIYNLLS